MRCNNIAQCTSEGRFQGLTWKVIKTSWKNSFVSWTTVFLMYVMRAKYYIQKPAGSAQLRAWHILNCCHLMCIRNAKKYGWEGISAPAALAPAALAAWQPWSSAPILGGVPLYQLPSIVSLQNPVPVLVFIIYCQGKNVPLFFDTNKLVNPSLILLFEKTHSPSTSLRMSLVFQFK